MTEPNPSASKGHTMAHDIHISQTGRAAMVSYRTVPWHQLGKVVDNEMSDQELLQHAGLDWRIEDEEIYRKQLTSDGETFEPVEGSKLLVRGDTGKQVSVVGENYHAFQNAEMVQLMRDISANTDLVWETAGALGDRAQSVWCMARMPEMYIALDDDVTETYMLISNGHGNRRSLQIMPTAVRVVCANTLGWAEGGAKAAKGRAANAESEVIGLRAMRSGFSISHTPSLPELVEKVKVAYEGLLLQHAFTKRAYEQMASVPVTFAEAKSFWNEFMERYDTNLSDDADPAKVERRDNANEKRSNLLAKLYLSPTNQTDAANGTAWGLYNTITEYVDHEAGTDAARFRVAQFGRGLKIKQDAMNAVLAL